MSLWIALAIPLQAAPPPAASPLIVAQDEAKTHLAQARLYMRKQWFDEAEAELERATQTPTGATNAEIWWLLAQVRYELLDAKGAMEAARTAAGVATDPRQAAQAQAYADWIDASFGVVEISAPQPGVQSRLQLERESLLLDPELKGFVDRVALAWTHPQALPLQVMLPTGDYRVQGAPLRVVSGERAALVLPMNALGKAGFAALQVTRLEISTGVGVLLGDRTDHMRPSWELQLGVTQPVGGWLTGVMVDYSVRSYSIEERGTARQPQALTLGARVGKELMLGGPLALRPALGYRWGLVPGIPLSCSGSDLVCTAPDLNPDPEILIYAVGTAHFLSAELNVDWRRAGRTNATGVGVRIAVDQLFGAVPAEGQALVVDADRSLDYRSEDGQWGATSLRMMANFSHAF